MGWHPNTQRNHSPISFNPKSPRFWRTRKRPTKRQRTVHRRAHQQCLCPYSYQIGGGQCGYCGEFSHRPPCITKDQRAEYVADTDQDRTFKCARCGTPDLTIETTHRYLSSFVCQECCYCGATYSPVTGGTP